jgi:hypothetical protein
MATNGNELTAKEISSDLTNIARGLGTGDLRTAMQNAFWGINSRGTGTALPANSDHYGLTFLTRPRLNLSYHNVLSDRRLQPLLSEDKYSIKRAIRCMLDPVGNKGAIPDAEHYTSPMINPLQCFMPILSDCLLSLSGLPDVVVETFTSEAGIMKEMYSLIDDVHIDYSAYDLTLTFKNVAGDPITQIFQTWLVYAASVYSGRMMPYPESAYFNEVDYDTRIYRLVLDPSRTIVQKIFCTGYAFPTSSPLGASFNYNVETPTTEENSQISVQFKCGGALYNDPIIVHEFNDVVGLFNPNMRPSIPGDPSSPIMGLANGTYQKVENFIERNKANYEHFARINPATAELEWYAPKDTLL